MGPGLIVHNELLGYHISDRTVRLTFPRKLDHWLGSSAVLRWGPQEGPITRKRHTEEQIIAVLKDAQAGIGVQELCRKHGISDATITTSPRQRRSQLRWPWFKQMGEGSPPYSQNARPMETLVRRGLMK